MSSTVRLGLFVVCALTIFALMVFLVGNKEFLFSRTYRLDALFDTVAGLDEGAPVRAGGVRIGTVDGIKLPNRPGDRITVKMDLESSTRSVIKKDSVATIGTEGLLGNKYVSISFGSAEAQSVRSGDTIQSQEPVDYGDLAKKASDLLDQTTGAVDNVNEAAADLDSIGRKVDNGQGTIGQLLNNPSAYNNLNSTLAQAKSGAAAFQADMDALKHNFFLRGFFKKRGYFDPSDLTKYAVARLPRQSPAKRFDFSADELFGNANSVKLSKDKALNSAGSFLAGNPYSLAVVVARTGSQGSKKGNTTLSEVRANAVRAYLAKKFNLDEGTLRTLGTNETPRQGQPDGTVSIVVYPAQTAKGR